MTSVQPPFRPRGMDWRQWTGEFVMWRFGNWANSFSLAVLLAGGLVLLAVYGQDANRRLDGALQGNLSELMERTAAREDGTVLAAAASTRSLRAFSGEYWQIAARAPAGPQV